MPAFGRSVVASALLLMSAGAATASPRSDRPAAVSRTGAAAVATHAAPTSAAKAAPRVIDPPVGDPVTAGSPASAAKAEAAPPPRPPSLADVVERIDRILREGAAAPPRRSSERPPRNNARKAAAARGTSGQPAERPPGRDISLVWPDAGPRRSTGWQVRWPADLDPHRPPSRPLGVRLDWPPIAESR